jgi:hypothetical protein
MNSNNSNCFFSSSGPFFHFVKTEFLNMLISENRGNHNDFKIFLVKGNVATKENLFKAFKEELSFPDYFGNNWDAFDECLNDLSWVAAKGYLVVLENGDDLINMPFNDQKLFFSVANDSVENWQKENIPFHFAFIGSEILLYRLKVMVEKEICIH